MRILTRLARTSPLCAVAFSCACAVDSQSTGWDSVSATTVASATDAASDGGSTSGTGGTGTAGTSGTSTSAGTSTGTSTSGGPGTSTTGGTGCGNGVLDGAEECDTSDFGGATCADFMAGGMPFTSGSLGCNVNCTIDTSGCAVCGDGMVSGTEPCDGNDLGTATCVSAGFDGGTLACATDCTLDTTGCTTCGDMQVDPGETCDSGVGGETCASQGFDGGTLACGADCLHDTSGCFTCGDGMIDGTEACDCGGNACTAAELANQDCTDFDGNNGPFTGGTLGCTASCQFDTSACTGCGDGIKNGSEDCDGADLGGSDCGDIGWLGGGTLACNADCTFDEAACQGPLCGMADAGVGPCPAVCSSCAAGWCIFDCPGDIINGGPCNDQVIDCPPGWPCRLLCGDAGCVGTTFNCSDGVCEIDCDGIDACGENAATTTEVNCGIQSCTATCDIFTEPLLNCGAACDCTMC